MIYQNENWVRTAKRPTVQSDCLIVDDDSQEIVKVVAHSEFDDQAFFGDSDNLKGVFSLSHDWCKVFVKQDSL